MAQGTRSTEIDFGELASSEKFTAAIRKLSANLDGTRGQLEALAKCDVEKLSVKDQVVLDLYLAYSVNALYWMYLRTKGINPATHPIKSEINRVRESVTRANKIANRKKPTAHLDKEAAKRFIRSGLWKAGEKPAGGVVKKFDSTSVGEASSSVSKVNEKVAEAKQFNARNGDINRFVKKFDPKSCGEVQASSSLSKVNEKGGETKQFKASNGNKQGFVKFNRKCVGDGKGTPSFSKGHKKGGDIKQFPSTNRQPEGVFKKFDSMNIGEGKASLSFNKPNEKGLQTQVFSSTNWKHGGAKKCDPTNTNVEAVNTSSVGRATKKGGKSKQFTDTKWKQDGSNKFDSSNTNVGGVKASSSFSHPSKKGGETKQFSGKTGKKSKYNQYVHDKDEKLNCFST